MASNLGGQQAGGLAGGRRARGVVKICPFATLCQLLWQNRLPVATTLVRRPPPPLAHCARLETGGGQFEFQYYKTGTQTDVTNCLQVRAKSARPGGQTSGFWPAGRATSLPACLIACPAGGREGQQSVSAS